MKKKVIMCKVTISKEGIDALKRVIRMAEAHISEWQFNDIDEKMAVRIAKSIVRDYAKVEKVEKERLKEYERCKVAQAVILTKPYGQSRK